MSSDYIGTIASGAAAGSVVPGAGTAIGLGVSVLKVGISELAQHTARVQDATNENEAAENIIPAYDADLQEINAAWNSGSITKAEAIQALEKVDSQVYAYLKAQVGKTGTAWSGPAPQFTLAQLMVLKTGTVACGKSCTVGCCLYYNDLHTGILYCISCLNGWLAFYTPAPTNNNCNIPAIAASSYGLPARASYTLYWLNNPPKGVAQQVNSTVNDLLGGSVSEQAVSTAPPPASTVATSSGVLGVLTNNTLIAVVTLIGGILIIVAYLFGSDAVRVNK
jgi:hypothetical protein